MIERISIRGEIGGDRAFGVAAEAGPAARDVDRGRVPDEIDDRWSEARLIEVPHAICRARDDELLEVGVALDGDARQTPAKILKREARPRGEARAEQAEISIRTGVNPGNQLRRSAARAQSALLHREADVFAERRGRGRLDKRRLRDLGGQCARARFLGANRQVSAGGDCRDEGHLRARARKRHRVPTQTLPEIPTAGDELTVAPRLLSVCALT